VGYGLRNALLTCLDIKVATAVLHNIAKLRLEDVLIEFPHVEVIQQGFICSTSALGTAYRQSIINSHFA